ncbi:hypothetical protein [Nocardioides sp. SYSU D00038]|uniref:hypothetical protein n=1 Tax=Nocardioides sp. SYSU D00038 TaxID=2812554 RepID=UPI00196821A9|nr:hypothetical protein [Nocardioides sp. SYSU D00038]
MTEQRGRLNAALYLLVLVLAAVAVVLVVRLVQDRGDDGVPATLPRAGAADVVALEAGSDEERGRQADVLAAAREMCEAFFTIRHDDLEASLERVRGLSTGAFLEQYEKATDPMIQILRDNEAVQEGEIHSVGIVASDPDSATLVAAVTTRVTNKNLAGDEQARPFRVQLELQREGDRWLTSDLQFVP